MVVIFFKGTTGESKACFAGDVR